MPPAAPVLLALDTATDRIHAALSQGEALFVRDLPGGALASATLLPALAELLGQAGCAWQDVDAIAFGSGPGAFTGLRTACSVAQGLALGLDVPVIALDTLMAVAEAARQAGDAGDASGSLAAGDTLWVLQDARMDELYVGAFQWDGAQWRVSAPASLWPLGEPAARWCGAGTRDRTLRWAGNAGAAYPDALAPVLPAQVAGPLARPHGAALAALARAAWIRGDTLDAALALPRYVRDKVAQTTTERAAGKFQA